VRLIEIIMSNWSTLPPTEKQIISIKSYNSAYGVKIHADTKQKAHDVISKFCPVQKLEFTSKGFVKGTNVSYEVINQKLFIENPYNKWLKEKVKSIRIENGIAYLTVEKHDNTLDLLSYLAELQGKMLTESSFSSLEDDLGYLRPQDLDKESEMYGADPMGFF